MSKDYSAGEAWTLVGVTAIWYMGTCVISAIFLCAMPQSLVPERLLRIQGQRVGYCQNRKTQGNGDRLVVKSLDLGGLCGGVRISPEQVPLPFVLCI